PGPDASRLPTQVPGQYLLLLRIEASDDGLNMSDLSAVGAGRVTISSGAAAGFPLPVLRYVVGGSDNTQDVAAPGEFLPLLPKDGTTLAANQIAEFVWSENPQAKLYRLEIEDDNGKLIHSAVLKSSVRIYRAPSWLKAKAGDSNLRWRVIALDQQGKTVGGTSRRSFRFAR
ncbi:MAG: hypothetical protein KA368_21860, partial [Acidobacteria bacterium]|nr:hypothetical protein [Acidobacteriota bacterium]